MGRKSRERYTPDARLTLNLSSREREVIFLLAASHCGDELEERGHSEEVRSIIRKVIE